MIRKTSYSAVILAGGKSERMGFPKAYLKLANRLFIEHIIDEYIDAGIEKIIVVMNATFCSGEWEKYIVPMLSKICLVKNNAPELGRFYSLKLGTQNLHESDFCFVHPVDNPFVKKHEMHILVENKIDNGITSPVFDNKGGHPVLLAPNVIREIQNATNNTQHLRDFFEAFPKQKVQMKSNSVLKNINTVEDYKVYVGEKFIA